MMTIHDSHTQVETSLPPRYMRMLAALPIEEVRKLAAADDKSVAEDIVVDLFLKSAEQANQTERNAIAKLLVRAEEVFEAELEEALSRRPLSLPS